MWDYWIYQYIWDKQFPASWIENVDTCFPWKFPLTCKKDLKVDQSLSLLIQLLLGALAVQNKT